MRTRLLRSSSIGAPVALALALLGAAHCGASGSMIAGRVSPGADASSDSSLASPSPTDGGSPPDSAAIPRDASEDGSTPTPALGPLVAYASGYGPNLNVYTVDETSGALTLDPDAGVVSFGTSPSFLAVNPAGSNLYAVDENATGQVGAYAIDAKSGALTFLNAVSSGGNGPPFVRVDATGRFVFVANYGDGTASVLPALDGGMLGAPLTTITVGTEAHMMIADPSNRFVFIPCKGVDYVAQFLFDGATGALTPNTTPHFATATGAGPRHLAFHPNGKWAFLVNETNSTLTALTLDTTAGTLAEIATYPTIPATFTGTNTAAEVWVDPSGRWVVASNRGDDSLVTFAIDQATANLTLVGFTPSGGMSPRDFTFAPSGAFVYAANQTSSNVVPFRFDANQGALTEVDASVSVTAASFVGLVRLPGNATP